MKESGSLALEKNTGNYGTKVKEKTASVKK